MCLDQGPQRSDAGEAQTHGPSVFSQTLNHLATALHVPTTNMNLIYRAITERHAGKKDNKPLRLNLQISMCVHAVLS